MAEQAPLVERARAWTIPATRAFADSLAAGLIRRAGASAGRRAGGAGDPLALARSLVLLPNNRAVRAVNDAFVRASGGALLLPRLVALGDPDGVGAALDAAGLAEPPPPAVAPQARRMVLARLVLAARGPATGAAEAVRLAAELERVLDQLLVEEVAPARLAALDLGPELSGHWQASLDALRVVLERWPAELAAMGRIDAADRRARVLDAAGAGWAAQPPPGLVCAAGITDTAPAVARLLARVAALPDGLVVFAGLDLAMPDDEWRSLGPHAPDPTTGLARRPVETHPQFALKLLLERAGLARGEVAEWPDAAGAGAGAGAARALAVADALAPAAYTGRWTALAPARRALAGVTAAEFATSADEAQGVAIALRGVLEEPGRTAALVTPDRGLARRVAAHLRRWGVEADDSAGRPLSILPPGTLLLALAEAAADAFAPVALLALLKHPLAGQAGDRLDWLDGTRRLDRLLRGPRPPAGLAGLDRLVAGTDVEPWWAATRARLAPMAALAAAGPAPLAPLIAALREGAEALAGEALWAGPAGRCAAALLAEVEAEAPRGPALVAPAELPALLRLLLAEVSVRPPPGLGHPRVAIYGEIEARLQGADLMVLGGLNEGVWPGTPAPDPWLAPRVRAELGLPGLERRVGTAAHDLAQALGGPRVLLTRARRDAGGPALPSRFWLRLEAFAGLGAGFNRDAALEGWAQAIDAPGAYAPAARPAPAPPAAVRPRRVSVTEVDRLQADPYAFYARRHLRLAPLEAVDAEPSAAWRGSEVHAVLQAWWDADRCAPGTLRPRALAMLGDGRFHPIVRALWEPRLLAAVEWIAERTAADRAAGRAVAAAEGAGVIELAGVTLTGRYDRVDRLPGGELVVIDYKTGKAPSVAAVRAGFAMQLGLLGLIAERGGFPGLAGQAGGFEYWSLAKANGRFGQVTSPVEASGKGDRIPTAEFTTRAAAAFADAAAKWLTGDEPFTAKLVPDYATYADYDQLMRRDEWYGRD